MKKTGYSIVLVTTSSLLEAKKIAKALLNKKLCACVNIIPKINSMYVWKGKLHDEKEVLLVIKIKKELFKQVSTEVKRRHSYTVPEVIALPILEGNKAYLDWIAKECLKVRQGS
jgi:periplasmic divalent cation tolerance protein